MKISRRKYVYIGGGVLAAAAAGGAYYMLTRPKAQPAPREFSLGSLVIAQNEPSKQYEDGAKAAAAAYDLELISRDIGFSAIRPLDATRELIAAGVKGIVSWAVDSSVVNKVARICEENNVFFQNWWSFQPYWYPWSIGDHYVSHHEEDSETAYYVMSKLLFHKLGGAGQVAHVQASTAYPNNSIRNKGIWDAWQDYPNINLVGHLWGLWQISVAKTVMVQTLSLYPDVAGIIANSDSMAVGASEAAEEAGLDLGKCAIGGDGVSQGINACKEGKLWLVSSYIPQQLGGMAVAHLYDAITGEYYPPREERFTFARETLLVHDLQEINQLASEIPLEIPFAVMTASDYVEKILEGDGYKTFWDWKKMSRGISKEMGLEYDPLGGKDLGGYKPCEAIYGDPDTYSLYIFDTAERFNDFSADTLGEANKSPYAPTSNSPQIDTYASWFK